MRKTIDVIRRCLSPGLAFMMAVAVTGFLVEAATGGEPSKVEDKAADKGSEAANEPTTTASGAPAAAAVVEDVTNSEDAQADIADSCLSDPVVLEELHAQKESMLKAQKEIADKEAELKSREQAINEEFGKLQALRDEITKTDTLRSQQNQEKVAKVIETLENMSPKASAKMMTDLDDSLAVEAISKMDSAKLAKIMNQLDSKRAAHLNEILAGVARAKVPPAATSAAAAGGSERAASNQKLAQGSTKKGGEYDDGQNHVESDATQRQPSSQSTGKGI